MATSSTPPWSAARSGLLGDTGAVDASAQVNQLLGTHAGNRIYQGNQILTPTGNGGNGWAYHLDAYDLAQPFTMSGTSIGRVAVPLLASGTGADLVVSLCANNSGQPGNVITQTRVPANWITSLSAVSALAGPSSSTPVTSYTGSLLATASGNALRYSGWQSVAWSPPATGATGGLSTAQLAQSGSYLIFAGGVNAANGNSSATVATLSWAGGTAVSSTMAGPQLPQPIQEGGLAVTSDSLCYVGGVVVSGASNTVQSTVYLASWNASTGAIGNWSVQTSLPSALVSPGIAAYNPTDTVYVVGGSTNFAPQTALTSTVYYASITGGQITSWATGAQLPLPLADPTVAVVGNTLIVVGGFTTGAAGSTAVYYAPINTSTGAPGTWQTGPPVPAGVYVEGPAAVSSTAIAWPQAFNLGTGFAAQDVFTLGWDTNGPGVWTHQIGPITVLNQDQVAGMVTTGSGTYQIFNFQSAAYITASLTSVPMISVPLPTTGLTNGGTYHVLLQQSGSDLNNYLRVMDDFDVFPGNPTALTRPKGSTTWTAATSGHAVPLQIYDNSNGTSTQGSANNQVVHTWEDSGGRIGTLVQAPTPDRRLLGLCEATVQPGPVLNANPTFTSGTAPWAGNNGTLAQSSSFTHGALPFSAQFTPNGVSTQGYLESELIAIALQQPYTAACWFYSPTGYSNCNIQINWYTAAGYAGYISSAVGATTSVAAATWTPLTVTAAQGPSTAVYATIGVYEHGTPPGTAVFYASAVTLQNALGPQLASVAQINYAGTWPGTGLWPPTGVTVLA